MDKPIDPRDEDKEPQSDPPMSDEEKEAKEEEEEEVEEPLDDSSLPEEMKEGAEEEVEEEIDTSKRYGRVKTPTVLQMEVTECGAASLSIILSYYKRFKTLEELRVQCGVSRDGSNVLNIIKAGRMNEMKAECYQVDPEEMPHIKPPFIVYWEDNHFLVVEGIAKKKVFLNDPAQGPRS